MTLSTAHRDLDKLVDRFCAPPREHRQPEEANNKRLPRGAEPVEFQFEGLRVRGYALGEGPVALLVHGWASRSLHLSLVARRLGASGYRVVAFDSPGHGSSEGRHSTLPDYCRFVGAAAKQVGGPRVAVGHSFGAAALALAAAGNDALAGHPRVKPERLVLLSCPDTIADGASFFLRSQGVSVELVGPMLARLEERYNIDVARYSIQRAAKNFDMPALLVHDRGDGEIPHARSETVAAAAPDARVHSTEGLGHNGVLGDRGVLRAIEEFVALRGAFSAPTNQPTNPLKMPNSPLARAWTSAAAR